MTLHGRKRQSLAAIDCPVTLARIEAHAAAVLDRMGYRLLDVGIDIEAGRARMEIRRHDGYTLTLDIRHGAGTITREMQRRETVPVGRRSDRFLADRLSMQFLGRTRIDGARAALRAFAETIDDNTIAASKRTAHDAIGMLVSPALFMAPQCTGM